MQRIRRSTSGVPFASRNVRRSLPVATNSATRTVTVIATPIAAHGDETFRSHDFVRARTEVSREDPRSEKPQRRKRFSTMGVDWVHRRRASTDERDVNGIDETAHRARTLDEEDEPLAVIAAVLVGRHKQARNGPNLWIGSGLVEANEGMTASEVFALCSSALCVFCADIAFRTRTYDACRQAIELGTLRRPSRT
jgi:hypothetical protein